MPLSPGPLDPRFVVVMVGLPARGKTFTAHKLAQYLRWRGHRTEVFNVGNYRRQAFGAQVPHRFFDPGNPEGLAARRLAAVCALDDLLAWLSDGGIAIYDATNTTRERRAWVRSRCTDAGADVLFVETVCDDPAVIAANVRATKLTSPDYVGMDPDRAVADFKARITHYENAYEPLDDDSVAFLRLDGMGQRVVANRIDGYLPTRLTTFLMNLHAVPRPLWFTRHGESRANVRGTLGGDEPLSERGREYAQRLGAWTEANLSPEVTVWTSTLRRTGQTGAARGRAVTEIKMLDEIDAGVFEGWTYEQIAQQRPAEFERRKADKLRYRYPQGESYEDVISRVEPVIMELERRRDPVLVIAHQAVLRALMGYFMGEDRTRVPHLEVPLHTVFKLTPLAYGCDRHPVTLGPER